ncbi:MAG: DUF3304 domain-containing protein [Burkholderiaceae bacterium]|nr:DUF3304 domain-containing protein [Burkholderiaceae bacterium]
MNLFKTILSSSHRAKAKAWLSGMGRRMLAVMAVAALVTGCASASNDFAPNKNLIGVSVGVVAHYGSGIGLPDVYLDGARIGNALGWGGGSGGMCCALLPRQIPKEPFMVKVKWITYRSNVDEELVHEATVPVHFAVAPGQGGSGLYVHVLPGHKIEVWYASFWPESPSYPGPAYPRRPAPIYVPLPGEKPQPTGDK